ncbi:MAG: PstS family phosphate ABC transporter substrate-binding protein [bacterium]
MKKRPFLLAGVALLWCLAMIPSPVSAESKYILIDGSSTVYPVTKLASEDFLKRWDSKVQMDVSFSGTTGGFRKFVVGEIDVNCASRPISREEIKAAKDYRIQFVEIPIAFDALTIAVNSSNTWASQISVTDLKRMWEKSAEGKVVKWSQIRPEWPDREIKLFGAGHDSGTYDYFKDAVVGPKGSLRSDYTASEDDDDLIKGIESDPGAIGFLPFAYFSKEGSKLKALAVQMDFNAMTGEQVTGAVATLPSEEAVHRGTYMPFGRPLFIYVNLRSVEYKPHLRDFLHFFLIQADDYVEKVHYLSLPKISYARSIADIEAKRTGTRFSGMPEIGLSVVDLINRQPR